MTRTATQMITEIFSAASEAVSPYKSVQKYCPHIASLWEIENFKKLTIVGFGKASCPMAKAIEDTLKNLLIMLKPRS